MKQTLRHQLIQLGLAALPWLTGSALAALPPAELFFKDPDIDEVVLSPSGTKLAITSAKGLERVGLSVIDVAAGQTITRVAQFSSSDVFDVKWLSEGRLVFKTGDLSDGSGSWFNARPGMHAVNSDGSSLHRIARFHPYVINIPRPVPGQANDEVLVGEFNGYDDEMLPIWVNTTRRYRTRTPEKFNVPSGTIDWLTDSHGELRVVFTRDKDKRAAYWRGPGATSWQKLYESGLLSTPFDIVGVDDVGGLYITRSEGPEGHRWLARYDFKAGRPEDKPIIRTPGFDFDGSLLIGDGSGMALGVRLHLDGETTVWFDPRMKALQAQVDARLPGRVNQIDCRRCGEPDLVALIHSYTDHDPGHFHLYQARPPAGEKDWRSIGAAMDGIEPAQMASMDLHRIKARDGRELPVWITRPDGVKGPLPAVVLVHDGPWLRQGYWGWRATPQFLASRGYLVIEPEMRGSTGYGTAHFEAGFRQWGQGMQDDVADALRWAQQQGFASAKACIVGRDYGGYSALMGLANDPDLFRCGVAGFAPTDLEMMVGGSWWVSDNISWISRKYALPDLVGDPGKDAAMLAAQSPVNQAARIKAPVMLVYGEKDQRVPLAHGKRMRDALRKAGNEPVWVSYDNEAHTLATLENRVDYAKRLEAFLARYLGAATP